MSFKDSTRLNGKLSRPERPSSRLAAAARGGCEAAIGARNERQARIVFDSGVEAVSRPPEWLFL